MSYRTPGRLQSEMNPSGPLRSGLWNRTGVTTAGWDAPPAIGANRRRAGSPSLARDAHLRHRRTEPEDRRVHPRVERSGRGAPSSDSDAQSVCYRLRPPSEPAGASRRQPQLPCPAPAGCGKSRLVVTNCERGSSPFHTFPPIRRAANPRGFAAIGFWDGKVPAGRERRSSTGIARERETSADDAALRQREGRTTGRAVRVRSRLRATMPAGAGGLYRALSGWWAESRHPSAWSRSAIRSSGCSNPTDTRMRSRGVLVSGPSTSARCSTRLSTPPRLVARVKSLMRESTPFA